MYVLADMALGQILEWFIVFVICKCGYFRGVDIKRLRARSARTGDLAKYLHCKRCGRRGDNKFTFRKMLREEMISQPEQIPWSELDARRTERWALTAH